MCCTSHRKCDRLQRMEAVKQPETLAHDWTKVINGAFIWLVVISHFGILNGLSGSTQNYYGWQLQTLGQLVVTTFLFFSGYGIMVSLMRNRERYVRKLIFSRLPRFWITFAVVVLLYAAVRMLLGEEIGWLRLLLAMTAWEGMGPPSWYVFMTLVEYVLIWCAFRVLGVKRRWLSACAVSIGTAGVAFMLGGYKPHWWYNTIMCMPAGMCFALVKEKVSATLVCLGKWGWLLAVACVLVGREVHLCAYDWCAGLPILKVWFGSMLANAGAVLFAMGIALVVARLSVCMPSPVFLGSAFLKWCGGSALIYIFLLHNLPIRVVRELGWSAHYELGALLTCAGVTLILAYVADSLLNGKWLQNKQQK